MKDRVACLVPYCRRTKKATPDVVETDIGPVDFEEEWICTKHWAGVAHETKVLHRAAKRRAKARRDSWAIRVAGRIWGRCRRQATEAAGGLR